MFCDKCGNEYDEKQGVCPCCGAPAPTLIAGEDKGKLRAVWIVCAVAVLGAIAALFVILRSGAFQKSDAEIFISLQRQALLEPVLGLFESGKGDGLWQDSSQDITIRVNDGGTEASIWIKETIQAEKEECLINIGMDYMGIKMEVVTLTAEDGRIGFYAPLLDNHYYVMEQEALLGLLADAGLDVNKVEEEQKTSLENVLKMGTMISKYSNILLSVVTDDNVTMEKQTLSINGAEQEYRVYTFRPGARELEDMFTKLLTELKADEELKELCYNSYTGPGTLTTFYGADLEYDRYFSGGIPSYAEFESDWNQMMDEALEGAADLARRIAEAGFSWSAATDGRRIYRQRLAVDAGELVVYESAGNGKESRYDALRLADGEDSAAFYNEFTNSKNEIEGRFSMEISGKEQLSLDYGWNMNERSGLGIPLGRSVLTMDGERIELAVTRNEAGGIDHTLFASDYGSTPLLTVTTSEQPSTARAPRATPVDLSGYTLEELMELWSDILSGASGIGFY